MGKLKSISRTLKDCVVSGSVDKSLLKEVYKSRGSESIKSILLSNSSSSTQKAYVYWGYTKTSKKHLIYTGNITTMVNVSMFDKNMFLNKGAKLYVGADSDDDIHLNMSIESGVVNKSKSSAATVRDIGNGTGSIDKRLQKKIYTSKGNESIIITITNDDTTTTPEIYIDSGKSRNGIKRNLYTRTVTGSFYRISNISLNKGDKLFAGAFLAGGYTDNISITLMIENTDK